MHPHKSDANGTPELVAPSKGFREPSILSVHAFHIRPHSFLPRWLPTQVEPASKLILNDGIHPHRCFEGNALGHIVALDTCDIVRIKHGFFFLGLFLFLLQSVMEQVNGC